MTASIDTLVCFDLYQLKQSKCISIVILYNYMCWMYDVLWSRFVGLILMQGYFQGAFSENVNECFFYRKHLDGYIAFFYHWFIFRRLKYRGTHLITIRKRLRGASLNPRGGERLVDHRGGLKGNVIEWSQKCLRSYQILKIIVEGSKIRRWGSKVCRCNRWAVECCNEVYV